MKKTKTFLVAALLLSQVGNLQARAQGASDHFDIFRARNTISYSPVTQPSALFPASANATTTSASSTSKLDKVPCLRWIDDTVTPRAVLLCIHGLGLHKGTYEDFGRAMAKNGIITYAIDMRGFGSWIPKEHNTLIDFDGSLADIKKALLEIRKVHPGLPVILLGESMGGGIGIHATAMYPDLIDGLVSSVPSGDRFDNVTLHVGAHAIFEGFDKPMDIGPMVVGKATQKSDLKARWLNDPLCRTKLSPNELRHFQKFMDGNIEQATMIKDTPVLFIMGSNDKLVRPVATFKLFDSLATPNKDKVMSNSAEHLIFEFGQFKDDDLKFVNKWIDKKVIAKGVEEPAEELAVKTKPKETEVVALAPAVLVKPVKPIAAEVKPEVKVAHESAGMAYWIELNRKGKIYRCNNKMAFKSGDSIRFHVIPDKEGYAYILMKQSSSGKKVLLFPSADTGKDNHLTAKADYPLPKDWLTFDNTPGIEKLSLLYSTKKIADEAALNPPEYLTAYVSDDTSGAKDLVPTRMQLSWDDPTPVILPDQVPGQERLARSTTFMSGSLVKVSFNDPSGLMAVDVALAHQ